MGVGVYSSSFNDTGSSFLVFSDSYVTVDEYQENYLNEIPEDERDDALSYDEYLQDAYNGENMSLIEALEEAGQSIGMRVARRRPTAYMPDYDQFAMDRNIVLVAENDFLQIGWRSWETDFVVAVAGADERFGNIEANGNDMLECYGLPLDVLSEKYNQLQSLMEKYAIHSLQDSGFDCRYRTSGYTTSRYDKPDGLSDELANLKRQIQDHLEFLESHRKAGLHKTILNDELRPALLRDIHEYHDGYSSIGVRIPYADLGENTIILVDAFSMETVVTQDMPDALRDRLHAVGLTAGVAPLIRDAVIEDYFASTQASYEVRCQLDLLVSEDEFKSVNPDYEYEFNEEIDSKNINTMSTWA